MKVERKEYIDSLWNNTRIWKYVHLISKNKTEDAKKLFEFVPEHYKGTAIEFNMLCYETNICCETLVKEFSNWDDYIDYMKTFDDSINDILYQLDLFDSFMARNLK